MPQSFIPRLLSTSQPAIEFERHATHEDVGKGKVNTSHSMHMGDNIFSATKKALPKFCKRKYYIMTCPNNVHDIQNATCASS
jgi:hypothetical protein